MNSPRRVGEPVLGLSVASEGLLARDVVLRFPSVADVDAMLTAFPDLETPLLPGE